MGGCPGLTVPCHQVCDGIHQGVVPGNARPIAVFEGCAMQQPGFHFARLVDGLSRYAAPSVRK